MNKNLLTALIAFGFVLLGNMAFSQSPDHCGTDHLLQSELQTNPAFRAHHEAQETGYQQFLGSQRVSGGQVKKIPVVVHLIQSSAGIQITDARVQSQIDVLNEDFRMQNADASQVPTEFSTLASDLQIEFCLATIDPNGCPTDGINRVVSPANSSHDMADGAQLKALVQWDPHNYLNMWVPEVVVNNILGYATFPSTLNFSPQLDGVVINGEHFGRGNGTPFSSFNLGRTATHEVGHYLGLYHTFQSGCSGTSSATCSSQGDNVCDTPPTSAANYFCPSTQNTCTETPTDLSDMTMNYMDYVDDACMFMYTNGQGGRANYFLDNIRFNLFSAGNLTATGCDGTTSPGCSPTADFNASTVNACVGQAITFSDQSSGIPTGWTWTFTGGTPSSSTDENPVVTYDAAGSYSVSLTISNSFGSGSETKSGYITVVTSSQPPIAESFEGILFYPVDWYATDGDQAGTWQLSTLAASNGTNSMYVSNYGGNFNGTEDNLVSLPFDLTYISEAKVSFDRAYKKYNGFTFDSLKIDVSSNCGNSWNTEWTGTGITLITVGGSAVAAPFVPSASHWVADTLDLFDYLGNDNVRIRFRCIGGGGQDIYIDNINLETIVGSPSEAVSDWSFEVVNPMTQTLDISYQFAKSGQLEFKLLDLHGRVLWEHNSGFKGAGKYKLAIDRAVIDQLPAGIFILQGNTASKSVSKKLLKLK